MERVAARQLLPLKNEVRRKDRKRETGPHNRLVCPVAEILPSSYASDHSPFKEHQRDSKAAGHPLPVLLDLPFADESQRNCGCPHQQDSIDNRSHSERSRIAQAFLKVLDIDAERRSDEHARDVDASEYTMEFSIAQSKPLGELQRAEQNGASAREAVWKKPPLEGLVVEPYGVFRMHKEALIVIEDVSEHQSEDAKQETL